MSLHSDIDLLRSLPLFDGFSDEHLRLIAFSAETQTLAPEAILFDAGQILHGAHILASGRLRVTPNGGAPYDVDGPRLLCERALVVRMRAPAQVNAATQCAMIEVRRQTFLRLLEEYPDKAIAFRQRLAAGLARAASDLEQVKRRIERIGA